MISWSGEMKNGIVTVQCYSTLSCDVATDFLVIT